MTQKGHSFDHEQIRTIPGGPVRVWKSINTVHPINSLKKKKAHDNYQ